jgi:small subunit ribosomal protein S9
MTKQTNKQKYFEAVGRRKTATARVRISVGGGDFSVNDQSVVKYFPVDRLQKIAFSCLKELGLDKTYDVQARVLGGGIAAQAEAIRLGIARAAVVMDGDLKKNLRVLGFLTRDSRAVERKKYGLKKARRSPQWAKR